MMDITKDQFTNYLRSALHNLYYPDQLRRSPLTEIFGVAHQFNASSLLQQILINAIEKLKPEQGEPSQSRAWRIYEVLFYRYIRQFDRDVVANQLGISGRQFRREQRTALEALADSLSREYSSVLIIPAIQEADAGEKVEAPEGFKETFSDDLSWLKDMPGHEPTQVMQVLKEVVSLTKPLAERFAVPIEISQVGIIPDLGIPALALRHILLTLLSGAIPQASEKQINLFITSSERKVQVEIVTQRSLERANEKEENDPKILGVVQQLVEMFNGAFHLVSDSSQNSITLTFPCIEKIPVLIVDDNPDTLMLFQRYAANTQYTVTGVREPEKAIHLAGVHAPKIIFLDLMMPGVDGWEVLNQIRANPQTSAIPVVVVSILPQESLALTLGANAFLQKPINQNDFLNLLNRFFLKNNLT